MKARVFRHEETVLVDDADREPRQLLAYSQTLDHETRVLFEFTCTDHHIDVVVMTSYYRWAATSPTRTFGYTNGNPSSSENIVFSFGIYFKSGHQ